MMNIFVFWLLLALVVGIAAGSRGRSGFGWFILAVILSPLIGLILVLVLPNLRHERLIASAAESRDRESPSAAFELDGVYAEVPYRVLGDGSVEALMQGGIVRFRSADHLFASLGGGSPAQIAPAPTTSTVPELPTAPDSTGRAHLQILAVGAILAVGIVGLFRANLDHLNRVRAHTFCRKRVIVDIVTAGMAGGEGGR
jgi:hypothetical protein